MNMNKNEEFDTILSIESREELNSIIDYYTGFREANGEEEKNKLDNLYLKMIELIPVDKVKAYAELKGGIDVCLEYFEILEMAKTFDVPSTVCYTYLKILENEKQKEKNSQKIRIKNK